MGTIFNIQRFCVNDGPGIRTSVFLKGCPLRCLWCHNPESQSSRPQMRYDARRCLGCGGCTLRCPKGCHSLTPEGHVYDRTACVECGRCAVPECPAMERVGEEKTAAEVLAEVMKDEVFYRHSGGGMTVTGGEPTAQPEFLKELLTLAKEAGLHTAIETCGWTKPEFLREIRDLVDLFLWDVKESDPERHREYTGVTNEKILENLRMLDSLGAETILRCPIIPGYNDREEHFRGIGTLADSLTHCRGVEVEPFHPLGRGKREGLGMSDPMPEVAMPEEAQAAEWVAAIQNYTRLTVKRA